MVERKSKHVVSEVISLDAGLFFGQVEPFSGRERVARGDEWEPAGETLSLSKGLAL